MALGASEGRRYTPIDAGRFDAISVLYVLFALGYAAFIMINMVEIDPDLAAKYERMFLLAIAGITLHMIGALFARGEYHPPSTRSIAAGVGIFVAVGFIGLMIQWGYAFYPFTEDLSKTERVIFGQVAAVSEELFFCYGVYSLLINVMQSPFAQFTANLIVSFIFALFHLAVYGVSGSVMLLLFIGRFLMNLGYYYTQRISTSMIAHSMINLAATLGV